MIKRAAFLVLMVLFLALVSNTLAATRTWLTGRPESSRWVDGNNWGGVAPLISDTATTYGSSTPQDGPYIISGDAAKGMDIRVGGAGGSGNVGYLTMNGGTLDSGTYISIAPDSTSDRDGEFRMNGGIVNLGVTTSSSGHLNVGSGYTTCPSSLTGTLRMTGGVINATANFAIARYNASGYVYLDGGTIYSNNFTMKVAGSNGTAYMNITGNGKVIVNGDRTAAVASYIASGWLTGNGNNYEIHYDYNIANPGKTTVWAATGDFLHWEGFANFGPIALENIGNRNQVREGSSSLSLTLNGNATISADNTAAAQLTHATSGDTLVTEYKLTFDGDGDPNTGGETVDWTPYNDFLTTPSDVTYFTGDEDVEVTLHVRASNAAGTLADAGTYTATQTLTASWD